MAVGVGEAAARGLPEGPCRIGGIKMTEGLRFGLGVGVGDDFTRADCPAVPATAARTKAIVMIDLIEGKNGSARLISNKVRRLLYTKISLMPANNSTIASTRLSVNESNRLLPSVEPAMPPTAAAAIHSQTPDGNFAT